LARLNDHVIWRVSSIVLPSRELSSYRG
jgi:hypothetical protein